MAHIQLNQEHNRGLNSTMYIYGRSSWKTDGATEAIDGQLLTGTGQPVSLEDGVQEVNAGVDFLLRVFADCDALDTGAEEG